MKYSVKQKVESAAYFIILLLSPTLMIFCGRFHKPACTQVADRRRDVLMWLDARIYVGTDGDIVIVMDGRIIRVKFVVKHAWNAFRLE